MNSKRFRQSLVLLAFTVLAAGCPFQSGDEDSSSSGSSGPPRLTLFIGIDISGSFLNSRYYDDSLDFLARYIEAHLRGYGELDVPHSLFVGAIGGNRADEAKTFFPIQEFQNESVDEIHKRLVKIFPRGKSNAYTDFNAFFEQVATTVKNKKLVLKPISVVLISDGKPDLPGGRSNSSFKHFNLKPLELLSRNVTVRLLYTDAVTGKNWQTQIPRKRVRLWTQDAAVMVEWHDPKILVPGKPFAEQSRFFEWIKDNVDFGVRVVRVD